MHSLYTVTSGKLRCQEELKESEKLSLYYHDLFDYPLNFADLIKWNSSENLPPKDYKIPIIYQNGYYFLKGRQGLIYKRVLKNRISDKKMEIAKKASRVLSIIPTVLMVAVTGSLAMRNAADESDIDLMIITKKGTLWTTRALAYLLIRLFGIQTRKPFDNNQKDKLCLNMWLDESDLVWHERNLYTAHETAQISPLVNKNKIYEKFIYRNKWILNFWPNSVRILNLEFGIWKTKRTRFNILDSIFPVIEKVCYWGQIQYMKSKMTREIVTVTRAIFHPQDLGKIAISRLGS